MLSASSFSCPVNCHAFITLNNIRRILKEKGNVQLGLFVKSDVYRPMKIPKRKGPDSSNIPPKKPKSAITVVPCRPSTDAVQNNHPVKQSPQVRRLLNLSGSMPTLVDQTPGAAERIQDDDKLSKDVVTEKEHSANEEPMEQSVNEDSREDDDSEPEVIFIKEKENSTPIKDTQNSNHISASQNEGSSTVEGLPKKSLTPIKGSETSMGNTSMEVDESTKTDGASNNADDAAVQHNVSLENAQSFKKNPVNGPLSNSNSLGRSNLSSLSTSDSSSRVVDQPTAFETALPDVSMSNNVVCNKSSFIPTSSAEPSSLESLLTSNSNVISPRKSTQTYSEAASASFHSTLKPSNSVSDMSGALPDIAWNSNQTECTMTEVKLVGHTPQGQQKLIMYYFHPNMGCPEHFIREAFAAYLSRFANMRLSRKPATAKIAKFLIHPHRESNSKGIFRVKIKHYGKPTPKKFSLCLWNSTSKFVRTQSTEVPGIDEEEEFERPIILDPRDLFYFVMVYVVYNDENGFFLPPVATSFALNKVLVVTLDKKSYSKCTANTSVDEIPFLD